MIAIASQVVAAHEAEPEFKKALAAGERFEAILLNMTLAGLERSFTHLPGEKQSQANEAYSGLAMQELTSAMARGGGVGLAKMIASALVHKNQEHSVHQGAERGVTKGF